jgi:hypothetical protein
MLEMDPPHPTRIATQAGRCQTMTHDYKRHSSPRRKTGPTSLFAALSLLDGTVVGRVCEFREDGVGGLGPDERFGISIVVGGLGVGGGLEVDDGPEDAAAECVAG